MAEQNLGNMNVGLDKDTARMLEDVVQSSLLVAEYMEKSGENAKKIQENLTDISSDQRAVVESLRNYQNISYSILQSMQNVKDVNSSLLEVHKGITEEQTKQISTTERQVQLDQKKREQAVRDAEKEGQKLSKAVTSPFDALSKGVMSKLPGVGQAAMLVGGTLVNQASRSVSQMRDITRTGGMGMAEGMGVGQSIQTDLAIRAAELSIPFLKESYGTKGQLAAGAGTMFGLGGIRGEELTEMMERLPKAAYEAGVSFDEASMMMAKLNRVLDTTPDKLITSFENIADAAREAGANVSEWEKFVVDATVENAKYGATEKQILKIREATYTAEREELITRQELNSLISKAYAARLNEKEIIERLNESFEVSEKRNIGVSEQLNLRADLEATLLPLLKDSVDAHELTGGVLVDYAEKVGRGARETKTLTGVVSELSPIMGTTKDSLKSMVNFADEVEGFSRSFGYNSEQLSKSASEVSKTLYVLTKDQELAYSGGISITKEFAKELHEGTVGVNEITGQISKLSETFNMSAVAIMDNIKNVKVLSNAFDVSTSTALKWQSGMADGMQELFTDPSTSFKAANQALAATIPLLKEGKMQLGDYSKVLRNQMDVYHLSGTEATTQFNTLAHIVSKTNVRMSELSSQTEQLSKISKQLGVDQTATTSLLVRFNENLRDGSASLQDLEAIMKGKRGAAPGPSSMLIQQLSGMGGPLGEMFSREGQLGGQYVLPELIRTATEGTLPNRAVREALGRGNVSGGEFWESLGGREQVLKQLGSMTSGIINDLVPGETEAQRVQAFKMMSPDLLGQQLQAYGPGLLKAYDLFKGEASIESLKGTLPETPDPNAPIKVTATNTKETVNQLKLLRKELTNYSTGSSETTGEKLLRTVRGARKDIVGLLPGGKPSDIFGPGTNPDPPIKIRTTGP
jgi:hypothetical protein